MTHYNGCNQRINGDLFEIRVMQRFQRRCDVLFAQRTAGSRGLFDLMVVYLDGRTKLISCKRDGYIKPDERKALARFLARKPANLSCEVWYKRSARKYGRYFLNTPDDLAKVATRAR